MHPVVFQPASPQAHAIVSLWTASVWVCGFVLAVVTVSILYILIRFRSRGGADPPQIAGNRKLEIAWTVVPLLLVGFLFAATVITARAVDQPVDRPPDMVVVAHQWWWEVRYPRANAVTANEIRMPVERDVLLEVDAADVIHDFWVPRLGRKIDAIPGKPNYLWFRATSEGTYQGACAEYCGAEHAWMRFRIIVQSESGYQAWLASQAAPAANSENAVAQAGRTRFQQLTCVNCHNITGVNQQRQYAPDLTHIASRRMLAAERLANTPANLRQWLHQPELIKPNCLMPSLNLSESDLNSLTAYLESLK